MTPVDKLLAIFKNRPLLGGVIALVLLLVGLTLILTSLTPKGGNTLTPTPFMSTNFNNTKSEIRTLRFTGNPPNIPTKLAVARVALNPVASDQVAQKLIEEYKLEPIAQSKNIWKNDEASLFRDEKRAEYVFSQDKSLLATKDKEIATTGLVSKEIIPKAQSNLQTLLGDSGYQPIFAEVKYLAPEGSHLDETSEDKALYVEVPFALRVSNYPLYVGYNEFPPITMLIDAEGKMLKLTFQAQILTVSTLRESTTISPEQAIENILAGNGSIISAYQQVAKPLDLSIIYGGNLTTAKVEYRADLESGIAYPVYRFKGQILNSKGSEIQGEIVTPALAIDRASKASQP